MGFTRWLMADSQFTEFLSEKNLNSHMPILDMYRRMARAYGESADELHLTKADIERIVAAGRAKARLTARKKKKTG